MSPLAATVTIVGAILAVLGTLGVALLRNSRKSPEQRAALDNGWDKLTGGLERRIAYLEKSDTDKSTLLGHQTDRIADLEMTVAELRTAHARVQALNRWLTRRVEQLMAFIVHHELTPPEEEPRPSHD